MTVAIVLYLCMTLALTAVVVLHVAQVSSLAHGRRLWPDHIWTLLPGVASVVAWREGARALPIAFVSMLVLYVALCVAGAV